MVAEARGPFIECPICGRATPIPPTVSSNADYPGLSFPENYTISETLMNIAPVPSVRCTMSNCTSPATKYCTTCKKHLCADCAEFHNYFFVNHKCTTSAIALENAAYLEESLRVERNMMAELGHAAKNESLPEIPALAHERERIMAERREKEEKERKIKEEMERKQKEKERIEKEKREKERKEREEQERIMREKEEQERKEREERERIEREEQERKEREEQERREKEEQERREREEKERIEREEKERKEREEQEKKRREERAVLPHPWRQLVDRNTGKVFYFNKETKQKSDVRPRPDGTLPGEPEKQEEQKAAEPKKEEEEKQQQQQQQQKEEQPGEDESLPPPPPPGDDELPPGWIQLVEKKTGRVYYYHMTTKKTSWKRPTN